MFFGWLSLKFIIIILIHHPRWLPQVNLLSTIPFGKSFLYTSPINLWVKFPINKYECFTEAYVQILKTSHFSKRNHVNISLAFSTGLKKIDNEHHKNNSNSLVVIPSAVSRVTFIIIFTSFSKHFLLCLKFDM